MALGGIDNGRSFGNFGVNYLFEHPTLNSDLKAAGLSVDEVKGYLEAKYTVSPGTGDVASSQMAINILKQRVAKAGHPELAETL